MFKLKSIIKIEMDPNPIKRVLGWVTYIFMFLNFNGLRWIMGFIRLILDVPLRISNFQKKKI